MQEPYKLPYCQYVQPNRWWYLAYSKHVKREESKKNPSCYPKCDDIYIWDECIIHTWQHAEYLFWYNCYSAHQRHPKQTVHKIKTRQKQENNTNVHYHLAPLYKHHKITQKTTNTFHTTDWLGRNLPAGKWCEYKINAIDIFCFSIIQVWKKSSERWAKVIPNKASSSLPYVQLCISRVCVCWPALYRARKEDDLQVDLLSFDTKTRFCMLELFL